MQNWLTKSVVSGLFLSVLALAGCQKDEVKATLTPSNMPTLTASATTLTLSQTAGTQTAATFSWTPVKSLNLSEAGTTVAPAITYLIQFDKKGHNFGSPVSVAAGTASSTSTTTAIKVSDLNTALTQLGLTAGQAADVEVRLNASYATNSSTYSNVLPLNVTTYECKQPAAANSWSLIGTVGPGTDWSTDYVMTYDCSTSSFIYTGTLKAGEYKFRYGHDWAINLGGKVSTGGALTNSGDNLKIATPGTYTIELMPVVAGTTATGTFSLTAK